MIGDHLKEYTFDNLLKLGLDTAPDYMDKREGSPLYDATASAAVIGAKAFEEMRKTYKDTYAKTAEGEPLDLRAAESQVKRKRATPAVRLGIFKAEDETRYSLPIGARFMAIDAEEGLFFTVTEEIEKGRYKLTCEEAGSIGNTFRGNILPVEVRNNLKSAEITDILIPGENKEDDESFRAKYFEEKLAKKFGGNVAQYRQFTLEQDGVGDCQIYPTWQGGGTVKISVIDSRFRAASSEHIAKLQKNIDPTQRGDGLGLAPIGHVVTVATAKEVKVDISAKLALSSGHTVESLKESIKTQIESYFKSVRKKWGTPINEANEYASAIFSSQISASILKVEGVLNVSDLKLNGEVKDIEFKETAEEQELAVLGEVNFV